MYSINDYGYFNDVSLDFMILNTKEHYQFFYTNEKITKIKGYQSHWLTMDIGNCLFSPTTKNPSEFLVWCVFAELTANQRNFS